MKKAGQLVYGSMISALMLLGATPAVASLWTSGHGDLNVIYDGGELSMGWKLDDGGDFSPGDLAVVVPQSTFDYLLSIGGRPAGSGWDLIGVAAGEGYWSLPQGDSGPGGAFTLGAPFVGIGAEDLRPADWSGPIRLSLAAMSGPGHFSVVQGGFVPTFFMSTVDGIDGSDEYLIGIGGHDHVTWAFTAPGHYEVTLVASGEHVADGFVQSLPTTLHFQVIPEPSSIGLLMLGAVALTRVRRSRRHL